MGISEEAEHVRLKERLRRRRIGGMTQVDIVEEWIQIKDDLDAKWVQAESANENPPERGRRDCRLCHGAPICYFRGLRVYDHGRVSVIRHC